MLMICVMITYCRTLFFRCILISRFSYVENLLHFNLMDTENKYFIMKIPIILCLHFTENIAYHYPEMLISYADKVLVMGHSGNSHVFNFAILLKLRNLDAREIFFFQSIRFCLPATTVLDVSCLVRWLHF